MVRPRRTWCRGDVDEDVDEDLIVPAAMASAMECARVVLSMLRLLSALSASSPGKRRYSTVQLDPERSSAATSPRPRFSWVCTICSDIWAPYSGRSTARNTPIGVGS